MKDKSLCVKALSLLLAAALASPVSAFAAEPDKNGVDPSKPVAASEAAPSEGVDDKAPSSAASDDEAARQDALQAEEPTVPETAGDAVKDEPAVTEDVQAPDVATDTTDAPQADTDSPDAETAEASALGAAPLSAWRNDLPPYKGASPDATASSKITWERLAGATALDTMRAISTEAYPSGATTAILATMGGYWDALTASALAGLKDAPILLTETASLSSQARAELSRLGVKNVVIAGGTAVVSDNVAKQLKAMGLSVARHAGQDAMGTAREAYRAGKGSWGKTAIVATAQTFQDALSISPYAYAKRAPIFLTDMSTNALSAETLACIREGGFSRVVIVGGTAVVAKSVEGQLGSLFHKRLGGTQCYDTSRLIAEWEVGEGMAYDNMGLATGAGYWDALAGAAICGKSNSVIALVANEYDQNMRDVVNAHASAISTGYVLGGTAVVPQKYVSDYRVTYKNHDGSTLQSTACRWGETVAYENWVKGYISGFDDSCYRHVRPGNGDDAWDTNLNWPQRVDGSYRFDGWDKAVASVSGNATYIAKFVRVVMPHGREFATANTIQDALNRDVPIKEGCTNTSVGLLYHAVLTYDKGWAMPGDRGWAAPETLPYWGRDFQVMRYMTPKGVSYLYSYFDW